MAETESEEIKLLIRDAIVALLRKAGPSGSTKRDLAHVMGVKLAVVLDAVKQQRAVGTVVELNKRIISHGVSEFVVTLPEFAPFDVPIVRSQIARRMATEKRKRKGNTKQH